MRNFYTWLMPRYTRLPLIICGITQFLSYFCTKFVPFGDRVNMSLDIDRAMPILPAWCAIYVLSYLYWIIGYIAICRAGREHCASLCAADYVGKVISAAFFIFLPTTLPRQELAGSGVFEWMLNVIYVLDTPYNLFPSMHCFFSWLIARRLMYVPGISVIWKISAYVFTVLVFLSTLFTGQHVVVDIIAGMALAEIAMLVSRPALSWLGRRKCEPAA